MTRVVSVCLALLALSVITMPGVQALDLTNGLMYAVPAPPGGPTIDGNLDDWDLSAAEPVWISPQTAAKLHATVALMYDSKALYVGARVSLPGRPLTNTNNPVDAYWAGDCVELRLASDPTLPAPLNGNAAVQASDQICHLTMWKNTATNVDYVAIAYGVHLNKGNAVNPPGSKIAITEGGGGYTIEARIPWTALNVPGGVNPFAAGSRMTTIWGIRWAGDGNTSAVYREDPGDFAFSQSQTWGQVEFSPQGHLAPRHPTMEEVLAAATRAPIGMPITINLPESGKVSVNIFGPHGEVIRELTGGEEHSKGPLTVYWDGYDQWGFPVTPGKYRWGAYISQGLKAEYRGTFGLSGTPPYQTADGRGGWIGDHSNLSDVAADASGFYAMCPVAEAQRSIIKLGYNDQTIWRRTPFAGGGWGPLYAMASNGKYLFIAFGENQPKLLRLDAATGQMLVFTALGDDVVLAPISDAHDATVPENSSPFEAGSKTSLPFALQPETSGIAATSTEVYASVFSDNIIQVMDPETGKPTRQLSCPSPRGLALDSKGNLYAVSYGADGASKILCYESGRGEPRTVIAAGLVDPWHVAIDNSGRIYVSQEGKSQQIAIFTPAGVPAGFIGRPGGRTWAGKYTSDALLNPAGLAIDSHDRLLIAESSIPKVVDRYTLTPLKLDTQWFGAGAYWNSDFPDPDNPLVGYYPFEPSGFGKAKITATDETADPTGSWDLERAGYNAIKPIFYRIGSPGMKYLSNGRKYLYSDAGHGICLVDGDQILPVGSATVVNVNDPSHPKHNSIELWSDLNGNHKIDPGETTIIDSIGGDPLPFMAESTASMWMNSNGDLYLISFANKILRIPVDYIDRNGTIHWSANKAAWCVGPVIPGMGDSVYTTWRAGLLGVRVDSHGNLYTCYNTVLPSLTDKLAAEILKRQPGLPQEDWQVYATPELAKQNHEGLGHSAESNAVKFVKFDREGRMLWVAGRKATAAAEPGQMYHFWDLAGLVDDRYIAGGSEWGQMYIYTQDGFYVDALFNNPGLTPPPGPYTFGGETAGGRIHYFKKLGQVWAYCNGMAYLVHGFDKNGRVIGEMRLSGTVRLDHPYTQATTTTLPAPQLTIVPLTGPDAWQNVPVSQLYRNHLPLATAQVAYDAQNIYVHVHVDDPTPLQNGADNIALAFKGGDAVGIDLGPAGNRLQPGPGDIRILAARVGGVDHLIAMKPVSKVKRPQEYYTPAGGRKSFDFVGDLPGGKAVLTPDKDGQGYTADLTIPRSFVDVPIVAGTPIKAEIEVLLSGQGERGLQATSRNYLFTPLTSDTSMTDDIPTESWLYPRYWGLATVK